SHFITAYLALLALPLWVVVKPSEIRRRLLRGLAVGIGSLMVASWVLAPLVADRRWAPISEASRGTSYYDSFGARTVLRWLFTGRLFDFHRLPVLSLVVGLGVAVAVTR